MLLQSIQLACKVIARATAKAGIANLYGVAGNQNTSGDDVKKLDVLANEVFINTLTFSGEVYIMASEENKDPIILEEQAGGYAIVFDPLDGSSNIDANVSVGTIFGIYRKDPKRDHKTSARDVLKPGTELVCSGYAVYGASTMIVLTTGLGVNGFSLDPTLGEFILTHPNIKIPRKGSIYSINEGNAGSWDEPTRAFVASCKQKNKNGKPKTARYIGSMVADVHRTLLYGGIFCYPADAQNVNGKLRLLYECNPIAFLCEQAGGKATTGTKRILDIQPKAVHERTPIFCGSFDDVTQVEALYKGQGKIPSSL
jgi:fructose-1,6-bisphosphatase I